MSKLKELGGKEKFTVIKNSDVEKYLMESQKSELAEVLETVQNGRAGECKTICNEYLVINLDEPYVAEVMEIMKRNGHWG